MSATHLVIKVLVAEEVARKLSVVADDGKLFRLEALVATLAANAAVAEVGRGNLRSLGLVDEGTAMAAAAVLLEGS